MIKLNCTSASFPFANFAFCKLTHENVLACCILVEQYDNILIVLLNILWKHKWKYHYTLLYAYYCYIYKYINFTTIFMRNTFCRCIEDTQSDYVEFSNFHVNLKDRKMYRSCGTMSMNHPDPQMKTVNSDGNFFRVTFKSNDVYDATGFEGFYQFRKYIGKCGYQDIQYNKSSHWITVIYSSNFSRPASLVVE